MNLGRMTNIGARALTRDRIFRHIATTIIRQLRQDKGKFPKPCGQDLAVEEGFLLYLCSVMLAAFHIQAWVRVVVLCSVV